jgi:hypothetical protein
VAGCHSGATIENLTDRQVSNFWKKVDRAEGCWHWTGAQLGKYGAMRIDGKLRYAHRLGYAIEHGRLEGGLVIRHMCHDTLCVRPDHLATGTQADNMRDRWERHSRPVVEAA